MYFKNKWIFPESPLRMKIFSKVILRSVHYKSDSPCNVSIGKENFKYFHGLSLGKYSLLPYVIHYKALNCIYFENQRYGHLNSWLIRTNKRPLIKANNKNLKTNIVY